MPAAGKRTSTRMHGISPESCTSFRLCPFGRVSDYQCLAGERKGEDLGRLPSNLHAVLLGRDARRGHAAVVPGRLPRQVCVSRRTQTSAPSEPFWIRIRLHV